MEITKKELTNALHAVGKWDANSNAPWSNQRWSEPFAAEILSKITQNRAKEEDAERAFPERLSPKPDLAVERSGYTPKGGDFPDGGATTITLDELAAALWLSGHLDTARQNAEHSVRTVLRRRRPPEPEYKAGDIVRSNSGGVYIMQPSGRWRDASFKDTTPSSLVAFEYPSRPLTLIGRTF
jgi:hypothetical protein